MMAARRARKCAKNNWRGKKDARLNWRWLGATAIFIHLPVGTYCYCFYSFAFFIRSPGYHKQKNNTEETSLAPIIERDTFTYFIKEVFPWAWESMQAALQAKRKSLQRSC